jgi:hypothetical protein
MNVIFGWEARSLIGDKFTTLELDTIHYKDQDEPTTLFAVVGPDDLSLEGVMRLKEMIPIHESLMENYQAQNWIFCIQAIGHLKGNICDFMDTFYASLMSAIFEAQKSDDPDWTHVIKKS